MAYLGCFNCKHYEVGDKCSAFPQGILLPIISGEIQHTKPLKAQENKIVYEQITDDERKERLAQLRK